MPCEVREECPFCRANVRFVVHISREVHVSRSTRNPTDFAKEREKPPSIDLILVPTGHETDCREVLHGPISPVNFELARTSSTHLIRGHRREWSCFPHCPYIISRDNCLILPRKTSDWSMRRQYVCRNHLRNCWRNWLVISSFRFRHNGV